MAIGKEFAISYWNVAISQLQSQKNSPSVILGLVIRHIPIAKF